jgi:hypothetical protein
LAELHTRCRLAEKRNKHAREAAASLGLTHLPSTRPLSVYSTGASSLSTSLPLRGPVPEVLYLNQSSSSTSRSLSSHQNGRSMLSSTSSPSLTRPSTTMSTSSGSQLIRQPSRGVVTTSSTPSPSRPRTATQQQPSSSSSSSNDALAYKQHVPLFPHFHPSLSSSRRPLPLPSTDDTSPGAAASRRPVSRGNASSSGVANRQANRVTPWQTPNKAATLKLRRSIEHELDATTTVPSHVSGSSVGATVINDASVPALPSSIPSTEMDGTAASVSGEMESSNGVMTSNDMNADPQTTTSTNNMLSGVDIMEILHPGVESSPYLAARHVVLLRFIHATYHPHIADFVVLML